MGEAGGTGPVAKDIVMKCNGIKTYPVVLREQTAFSDGKSHGRWQTDDGSRGRGKGYGISVFNLRFLIASVVVLKK